MNKFTKFPVLLLTLFLLPVNVASVLHASEHLPFNTQLKKLIRETFYKEGQPSMEKITQYRSNISHRYNEVKQNLKNLYILKKGNSKKKAKKKIKKKSDIQAYKILLDYIEQLKLQEDPIKFHLLALKILQLDYALKIEARRLPSVELIKKVPLSLKGKKIPIRRAPKGEASNLVNPGTGLFYSQDELSKIKRQGGDVSKLNPPSDSTFWTDHTVSRIDVSKYYLTGQAPLHKGNKIIFPDKKAYFDKVRKTQSKPKLDLFILHNGKKLEFKLKIGAEVHSEITSVALYTALGYSTDISKYVRDFKVILGEVTHYEFHREWKSYYSSYYPDKYLKV